jgi:hypothetical protein
MKALRLPTCVSAVAYLFRFRRPRDPPVFVFAEALLKGRRPLPARAFGCRPPVFPAISRGRQWDLSGLQAIHPVPVLRSWTPVEPMCPCRSGHSGAAPRLNNSEGFGRWKFRGSLTQPQHLLSYASRFASPLTRKAGFRLAGWPLPGGCRTLWIAMNGFRSHDHSPFLFS